MPKPHSEMSISELTHEMEAWHRIMDADKGYGHPSNAARIAAECFYAEADAWRARRVQERERQ